jgi:hypothetical protein
MIIPLKKAKAVKKTIFRENFFIKYWKNKGGFENKTVEVEIKTKKLENKEYNNKLKMFIKDIEKNGGFAYFIDTESILAYFNVIVFDNYYLKVIENY